MTKLPAAGPCWLSLPRPRHLATSVGFVVLVDRQLDAVIDVNAELGVRASLRTDVAEGNCRVALGVSISSRQHCVGWDWNRGDDGEVDLLGRGAGAAWCCCLVCATSHQHSQTCGNGQAGHDSFVHILRSCLPYCNAARPLAAARLMRMVSRSYPAVSQAVAHFYAGNGVKNDHICVTASPAFGKTGDLDDCDDSPEKTWRTSGTPGR